MEAAHSFESVTRVEVAPLVKRMASGKSVKELRCAMVEKIFTPLNIGALELEHRIVIDWGRALHRPLKLATGKARSAALQLHPAGLVIYDVNGLVQSPTNGCQGSDLGHLEAASCLALAAAKRARQPVLARLGGEVFSQALAKVDRISASGRKATRHVIQIHVDAARRALLLGFDGIELDGTFLGSTKLPDTPHAGTKVEFGKQRDLRCVDVVLELIDSLTRGLGRDRVGVRLAPFCPDALRGFSGPFYKDLLRALHELEVAYVHVVGSDRDENSFGQILPLPLAADALRKSYPGIVIATCRPNLPYAIELVESRWADAICFLGETLDAKAMVGIARAWQDGKSV
jgi:N-ethylmaleimide reductase